MGMCYEYKNDFENAKRCYMKVGIGFVKSHVVTRYQTFLQRIQITIE